MIALAALGVGVMPAQNSAEKGGSPHPVKQMCSQGRLSGFTQPPSPRSNAKTWTNSMRTKPPPLTDAQIRSMFKDLNGTVTNLVLSMAVVHDLLLSKNYVTKTELSAASEKVRAEAKDAIAKIRKSHRRDPNGGTQIT
jgi:hypothetical protein